MISRYDPERHHRQTLRLKGYDYSQPGAYFVTICTHERVCLLGVVADGEMRLNALGEIVERTWHDLPNHVIGIILDAFVVMPNHIHGIVIIVHDNSLNANGVVGAGSEPAPTEPAPTEPAPTEPAQTKRHGLPEIIRQFKTFSARRINEHRGTPGVSVWQRNYYDRVIRDEDELNRIRRYIANNPLQWQSDNDHPGQRATAWSPRHAPA